MDAVLGDGVTASLTGFDTASSVKLDNASNQYVCGTFNGTVDFDPGPGTRNLINADSNDDAFLAKYTPSGQLLWVGQLVGSRANSLTLDSSGNVLVTGSFPGTTDFDLGPGTTTLTAGSSCTSVRSGAGALSEKSTARYLPEKNSRGLCGGMPVCISVTRPITIQ